jgi:hypothetical protein
VSGTPIIVSPFMTRGVFSSDFLRGNGECYSNECTYNCI